MKKLSFFLLLFYNYLFSISMAGDGNFVKRLSYLDKLFAMKKKEQDKALMGEMYTKLLSEFLIQNRTTKEQKKELEKLCNKVRKKFKILFDNAANNEAIIVFFRKKAKLNMIYLKILGVNKEPTTENIEKYIDLSINDAKTLDAKIDLAIGVKVLSMIFPDHKKIIEKKIPQILAETGLAIDQILSFEKVIDNFIQKKMEKLDDLNHRLEQKKTKSKKVYFTLFKGCYSKLLTQLLIQNPITKDQEVKLKELINDVSNKIKISFDILENDEIVRNDINDIKEDIKVMIGAKIFKKGKEPTAENIVKYIDLMGADDKTTCQKIDLAIFVKYLSVVFPEHKEVIEKKIPQIPVIINLTTDKIFNIEPVKPSRQPAPATNRTNNNLMIPIIVGAIIVSSIATLVAYKKGWLNKAKKKFLDAKKMLLQKLKLTKHSEVIEE